MLMRRKFEQAVCVLLPGRFRRKLELPNGHHLIGIVQIPANYDSDLRGRLLYRPSLPPRGAPSTETEKRRWRRDFVKANVTS